MLGSAQPGRIAEHLSQAIHGGCGDDGFVQRFNRLDKLDWRAASAKLQPRRVR
jgi:hypothetical protein